VSECLRKLPPLFTSLASSESDAEELYRCVSFAGTDAYFIFASILVSIEDRSTLDLRQGLSDISCNISQVKTMQ
jgi:hypothetical protein